MNREELELHDQHLKVTEELIAAKQAHRDKPTEKTAARVNAAKTNAREFTDRWRGIRSYFKAAAAEGVATVETITTKARS